MFTKRKWIHGRIVGVVENESAGTSIKSKISPIRSNWSSSSPISTTKQSNGIASIISSTLRRATGTKDNDRSNPGERDSNNSIDSDILPEQRPIVVLFRHSSPMERLLTQSAMKKVLSFTGRSSSGLLYSPANPYRNLLPIELAGIVAPPSFISSSILSASLAGTPTAHKLPLLDRLIQQQAKVSVQLLAHRTATTSSSHTQQGSLGEYKKEDEDIPIDDQVGNSAICHVHYQQPKQWFTTTNASLEMVRKGQAWINSSGGVIPSSDVSRDGSASNAPSVDSNPTVKQLQSDAKFISQLEEAEYSCWKSRLGMWSSDRVRGLRNEYFEEEEMLKNKWSVWSWIKKGWEWRRR